MGWKILNTMSYWGVSLVAFTANVVDKFLGEGSAWFISENPVSYPWWAAHWCAFEDHFISRMFILSGICHTAIHAFAASLVAGILMVISSMAMFGGCLCLKQYLYRKPNPRYRMHAELCFITGVMLHLFYLVALSWGIWQIGFMCPKWNVMFFWLPCLRGYDARIFPFGLGFVFQLMMLFLLCVIPCLRGNWRLSSETEYVENRDLMIFRRLQEQIADQLSMFGGGGSSDEDDVSSTATSDLSSLTSSDDSELFGSESDFSDGEFEDGKFHAGGRGGVSDGLSDSYSEDIFGTGRGGHHGHHHKFHHTGGRHPLGGGLGGGGIEMVGDSDSSGSDIYGSRYGGFNSAFMDGTDSYSAASQFDARAGNSMDQGGFSSWDMQQGPVDGNLLHACQDLYVESGFQGRPELPPGWDGDPMAGHY